jgi:hypothetical protein
MTAGIATIPASPSNGLVATRRRSSETDANPSGPASAQVRFARSVTGPVWIEIGRGHSSEARWGPRVWRLSVTVRSHPAYLTTDKSGRDAVPPVGLDLSPGGRSLRRESRSSARRPHRDRLDMEEPDAVRRCRRPAPNSRGLAAWVAGSLWPVRYRSRSTPAGRGAWCCVQVSARSVVRRRPGGCHRPGRGSAAPGDQPPRTP